MPTVSTPETSFEQPILELRAQLEELESYPAHAQREAEIAKLKRKLESETERIYSRLTPWEIALTARHSARPQTLDYIERLTENWLEVHGDRGVADDPAIVAGFATFGDRSVAIVGHQKGRSTRQRIHRNFGQPRPEGYRKALRVMRLAERFSLPVVSFIDTPGAYPGIGAEERGQAEAIARNLEAMAQLRVPIVAAVIGEGGSGGALALGVADRVLMLQFAIYSVISPEGCAAILWKDQEKRAAAAAAMRITATDLEELGVIESVIEEPLGGAHADPEATYSAVGEALRSALDEVVDLTPDERLEQRFQRFRKLGVFSEA